jgi:excisionase family DNA binding protein
MITIPRNSNTGIRIPAWTPPEKPKRKQKENIERIGLSVQEAADTLGVHKDTFMVLVKEGKVRTIKIGRRIIVSNQSLREHVDGKNTSDNSLEESDELRGKKE